MLKSRSCLPSLIPYDHSYHHLSVFQNVTSSGLFCDRGGGINFIRTILQLEGVNFIMTVLRLGELTSSSGLFCDQGNHRGTFEISWGTIGASGDSGVVGSILGIHRGALAISGDRRENIRIIRGGGHSEFQYIYIQAAGVGTSSLSVGAVS